jgi:aldehyde dehydrogenase (NAD+)
MSDAELFERLGLNSELLESGDLEVKSPINGSVIARVRQTPKEDVDGIIDKADAAFKAWRQVPAPKRGKLVRHLGEELRAAKPDLGRLVTLETGKIVQEGLGEVQEMIDICEFAVGLSRQLYGLTIASERPQHRMQEVWHPLGVCGVISAFNFPVAVWSWNAAIALVCGNAVVWKPSDKTPLTALACQGILGRAMDRFGEAPEGLHHVAIGGAEIGDALVSSQKVALISATGSTRMGRQVGPKVAARFGRSILELGGNNAMIVAPSADLDLAVRAIVFSAVGTAGQRCTTLRRLFVHRDVYGTLIPRLVNAYESISIGNPLDETNLVGPLIGEQAFLNMERALETVRGLGATVHGGGRLLRDEYPDAYYVKPVIVEMTEPADIMATETFAPILYALPYEQLAEAIRFHNDVPQGLSSCIFSNDIREIETFLSTLGSDCGIANVNIGPSGAEIGGAFGGEKETGGGRESGSDAWKGYMRRATNTYSAELPLAQGIKFDLD